MADKNTPDTANENTTETDGTAPASSNPLGPSQATADAHGDPTAEGTTETFPKPDGTPQAPNGLASADEQTNVSTPATASKPVNGLPVSDAPSNENAVEQTTGRHTQETESLIGKIEDWVKKNYEELVDSGARTWGDIERNADVLEDRAVAAFARKRAAETGTPVDPAQASTAPKTTR